MMWDKIEAFEMWLWRKCTKTSYTEHKTNKEVVKWWVKKYFYEKKLSQENFVILGILFVKMGYKRGY